MTVLEYKGNGVVSLFNCEKEIFTANFQDIRESIIESLKEAIKKDCLILTFKNFPSKLNYEFDVRYGEAFKNKFKYSSLSKEAFIKKMLNFSEEKKYFHEKLMCLFSVFNHIQHNDSININVNNFHLEEGDIHMSNWAGLTQNPKLSANFFKSEKFNKPEISFFTDASVSNKTFYAGYGVSKDTMKVTFRFEDKTKDNNLAEILALVNALELAKSMNLKDLEIFTDSDVAINLLKKFPEIKSYVEPIKKIYEDLKLFDSYQIAWIPRKKNHLADKMSKFDFV